MSDPLVAVARHLKSGDYEAASRLLAARIGNRSHADLSDGEVAMAARIEHRRRRWDDSLPYWREIVRRDPANTEALFRGGQALLETRSFELGLDYLWRAEAAGASLVDVLILQARALEELGRPEAELDVWRRLADTRDERAAMAAKRGIPLARRLGRPHEVLALARSATAASADLSGVEEDIVDAVFRLRRDDGRLSIGELTGPTSLSEEGRIAIAAAADLARGDPTAARALVAGDQTTLGACRDRLRTALFLHDHRAGRDPVRSLAAALDRFAAGDLAAADLGDIVESVSSVDSCQVSDVYVAGRIAELERGPAVLADLRKAGHAALALRLGSLLVARSSDGLAYAAEQAVTLRSLARYADAAAVQLTLAARTDDPWPSLVAAIDALMAGGRLDEVAPLLERLDAVERVVPARQRQLMLLKARYAALRRDHPAAIEQLERLLVSDVRHGDGYIRLSAAFIALSDYERALTTTALAATVDADSVSLRLNAATAHRALGDLEAADDIYRRIVDEAGGADDRVLPIVADFVRQLGERAALDAYLAKAERWPRPAARLYRATLLYEFGDLDAAASEVQAQGDVLADHDRLAAVLCRVLVAQNRYDDAIALFSGFDEDRLSAEAARSLTAALVYAGRFDDAAALIPRHPAAFASEFGRLQTLHNRVELELNRSSEGPWWGVYRDFPFLRTLEADSVGGRYVAGAQLPLQDGARPLLACAVQGVGDEIRNASLYADVLARHERATFTCDPRLHSLFARSFPAATFLPCARRDHGPVTPDAVAGAVGLPDRELDRILDAGAYRAAHGFEIVTTVSDCLAAFRPNAAAFARRAAYLVVDQARKAQAIARVADAGERFRIGVCWRSAQQRPMRNLYYTRLADWGSIFDLPGTAFFNFLHGDCEAELADAEARFGVSIDRLADIDLRDDFEGVAAMLAAMDLVIAPCVSVAELAAAVGTPVLMLWRTASGGWRLGPGGRDLWHETMTPVFGDPASDASSVIARASEIAAAMRPASRQPRAARRANQATAAA